MTYAQDTGLPTLEDRALLASCANEHGRQSRRIGARTLSATSSREDVLAWLQWNDPNGTYEDCCYEDCHADCEPVSLEDAWQLLETTVRDDCRKCGALPHSGDCG